MTPESTWERYRTALQRYHAEKSDEAERDLIKAYRAFALDMAPDHVHELVNALKRSLARGKIAA